MNPAPAYVRKTKPTLTGLLIPAFALLLAGIIVLTKILLLGLLLIVLGVFAITITEGLEIDFTHRRIRIFFGFYGLRFGKWETLPAIERITLVPVNVKYSMTSRTNLTSEISKSYVQVRIYPQRSSDYYIASMGKFTSCRKDAHILSNQFGLVYEDYTEQN